MRQQAVRILQAIGSLNIGGSQAFVLNLYRNIDRSKVQFDFVIEHPGELHYAKEIKELGGRVYELRPFTGGNVLTYRRQWKNLFDSHPEWKVLHSHVRSTASLYLPIARQKGVTCVIHSHSTSEASGFRGTVKRAFEYPLRYQADYFFACSEAAGRWLYGDELVDAGRVKVLSNAIDIDKFAFDQVVRDEVRSELGIDKDCFVVGHVGRFVVQKNHDFLLDVFERVLALRSDSKLLLVGDGELRSDIESKLARLGLQDAVIMLGARDDVWRFYQAMDVFVLPSLNEGLGIVLLEAQTSGLPCVVSDAVPREACVTSCGYRVLSLRESADAWANASFAKGLRNRGEALEITRAKAIDIESNTRHLEDFYYRLGCAGACNEI